MPIRIDHASLSARIDTQWNLPASRRIKTDWLALETIQRDILECDMPHRDKLRLLAEAIGAWTGRGIPGVILD